MNNNIKRIKATMENVAANLKLPESYQGDLATDFRLLPSYRNMRLIWMLRTCGTVLVPTNLGADPVHVTHWLWSDHGQKIVPFLIHTTSGLVEKISFEEAEKLIMEPPCNLSSLISQEALIKQVNEVLETGCKHKVWGVFDHPIHAASVSSWGDWRNYFSSTGNRLMADFMGKALRLTRVGDLIGDVR